MYHCVLLAELQQRLSVRSSFGLGPRSLRVSNERSCERYRRGKEADSYGSLTIEEFLGVAVALQLMSWRRL